MRASVLLILSLLVFDGRAFADCVSPVSNPASAPRSAWSDVETLVADSSSNSDIQKVQTIAGTGYGDINTDFYAITINKGEQTAAKLMAELRSNMSEVIFAGSFYSLSAYDATNAAKWASASPKGALMSFTLAKIPGVMDLERGSVVVSCASDVDFVFSTVTTAKDGLHPVSGNRAFGVRDIGNGKLQIFTKAADRVINEGIFRALPASGRKALFEQGHKVWLRLLDNLTTTHAARNPHNRIVYSERKAY